MSSITKVDMTAASSETAADEVVSAETTSEESGSSSVSMLKMAARLVSTPTSVAAVSEEENSNGSAEGVTPDPSTYYQVLQNMNMILKNAKLIVDIATKVQTIEGQMVIDPDNPSKTWQDIVNELQKSIDEIESATSAGIEINTSSISTNNVPSSYKDDVTYEIKLADAIGLATTEGYDGTSHVLVQTISTKDIENCTLKSFQVASNNGTTRWIRHDDGNDVWTGWIADSTKSETDGEGEVVKSTSWILSDTQPADDAQVEGDYWFQTLSDDTGTVSETSEEDLT